MTIRSAAVSALFAVLGVFASAAYAHPHDHPHAEAAHGKHTAAAVASNSKGKALDAHTREDIERHEGMARAHAEAAQCLASGRKSEECTKQLQASCKGLALGKNCGMRHSH